MSEAEQEWYVPELTAAEIAYVNAQERNGNDPDETEEDSWLPTNLAELAEEPPVKPELGNLGMVYPGKRHVFSGPQESAKTLAAYVIGLEVIRAGEDVWLIDFEMGPWDARTRLRELGASVAELGAIHYVEPDTKADEAVIGRIVEQKPGLVIIDAIAGAFDLHELDDNKRSDVEKFARIWLQPFRRAKIATIALDHVTKNVEGRGKYAIGSERKVGGADVHLGFEVVHPIKRGGHGLYKIVTHKDRGGFLKRGKLAEFELSSDPETHLIRWELKAPVETDEEHAFRPTHLMEKVSRYLELVTESVSRTQVEKDVTGKGTYIRQALDILRDEGFVDENPGPNRTQLVTSTEPYREAFDNTSSSPSPVRPQSVPKGEIPSPSLRPLPSGGDAPGRSVPRDDPSPSQGSLNDDDGIPF